MESGDELKTTVGQTHLMGKRLHCSARHIEYIFLSPTIYIFSVRLERIVLMQDVCIRVRSTHKVNSKTTTENGLLAVEQSRMMLK